MWAQVSLVFSSITKTLVINFVYMYTVAIVKIPSREELLLTEKEKSGEARV